MSQNFENKGFGKSNWQMPDACLQVLVSYNVTNDSTVNQMKAKLRDTCVNLTLPNAVDTPGDVFVDVGGFNSHSNRVTSYLSILTQIALLLMCTHLKRQC